jgi:hypothetical protein
MTASTIKDEFVPTTIPGNFTEIPLWMREQNERSLLEMFPGEIG